MDCFRPLIEKLNGIYNRYPLYPVADAGYGSFNNYLYSRPVKGNRFGRTEELYQCEDCSNHNASGRKLLFKLSICFLLFISSIINSGNLREYSPLKKPLFIFSIIRRTSKL